MNNRAGCVTLALMVTACAGTGGNTRCNSDVDCKGSRVCESGQCVDPASTSSSGTVSSGTVTSSSTTGSGGGSSNGTSSSHAGGSGGVGSCTDSQLSITGSLLTDVANIDFTGATVTAEAGHKIDIDAVEDGCLSTLDLQIHLNNPVGCTLHLALSSFQPGISGVLVFTLDADSRCPNFLDAREGNYESKGLFYPHWFNGPDSVSTRMAPSACLTGVNITFPWAPFVLKDQWSDKTLSVDLSQLRISGSLFTVGSVGNSCPVAGTTCASHSAVTVDGGDGWCFYRGTCSPRYVYNTTSRTCVSPGSGTSSSGGSTSSSSNPGTSSSAMPGGHLLADHVQETLPPSTYTEVAFSVPVPATVAYLVSDTTGTVGLVDVAVVPESSWAAFQAGETTYLAYAARSGSVTTNATASIPAGAYHFAIVCRNAADDCVLEYSITATY